MEVMIKFIRCSTIIRPSLVIPILSLLTSSASCFPTAYSFLSLSSPGGSHIHSSRPSITAINLNSSKATTSSSSANSSCSTSTMMPKDCPYGAWESQITSKSITAGSVRMGNLKVHTDGNLYWMEGRPQEGGRYVLCKYDPTNPFKSERDSIDVTPTATNVRTRVHEYGGAALTWGGKDETFLSEFATQQLCRLNLQQQTNDNNVDTASANTPVAITPGGNRFRFADGVYDEKRKVIFCVREDHEKPAPIDVVNEIVAVDTTTGEMKVLVSGYDFCAAPRLSSDGKTLVCVVWDHPNMPWDATKLLKVALADDVMTTGTIGEPIVVAGHDDDTSVIQPLVRFVTLVYVQYYDTMLFSWKGVPE
jgi:hypothetical protein